MKKQFSIILLMVLSLGFTANAAIKLPRFFGSNMILQQKSDAAIWGQSDVKGATVTVTTSWNNKQTTAKVNGEGYWRLTVPTPSYGGPYTITISDGKAVKLDNVMIGEVWVCCGQSNMEMPMKGFSAQPVVNGNRDIALSRNKNIRLFTVARNASVQPLYDVTGGEWLEADPNSVANFSATAYYFGRFLAESLGMPIGLIHNSWGGTSIERWLSSESVAKFEDLKKKDPNSERAPANLFNAMVNPLAGYNIKGFIWYQGETDRHNPVPYKARFVEMITCWREKWGLGDLSFYFVQLAPYNYVRYRKEKDDSPYIREAQMQTLAELPNVGMACLMDAGDEYCIHASKKYIVGERLAYNALSKDYGYKNIVASGPVYNSHTIQADTVIVRFDNVDTGMTSFNQDIKGFQMAGEDRKFYDAKAEFVSSSRRIAVTCKEVPKPVAVRYCFKGWAEGNVYNSSLLPMSSFRTDTWEREK